MSRPSFPTWPWLALVLVLGVLLGWLVWRAASPVVKPVSPGAAESAKKQAGKALGRPTPAVPEERAGSGGVNAAVSLLAEARAQISSAPLEERAAILGGLGEKLDNTPSEDAVAAILGELASGRDVATELPFVPGELGLESAPTWRVYLLDRLGRLDPRAAAEYARQNVFPSSDSAEEWAVSLRNVWHSYSPRATEQGRAEISGLLGQMLARPEWRAGPADGLLEALDFLAQTPDPAPHLRTLNTWMNETRNAATASAAQIAIERTMAENGDAVLPALSAVQGAAPLRAAAMARADLRSSAQVQAVAEFLRRRPAGSEETSIFFRAFPLHRFSVAPGLAGVPRVPPAEELRAADEAALAVVAAWSADPSLAAHREDLADLADKLSELTGRK